MSKERTPVGDGMFRILESDDAGPKEWTAALARYRSHLKRKGKRIPSAVMRYFSEDFFHDGAMDLRFDRASCTLDMTIESPNVCRRMRDSWRYTTIRFRCLFRCVDYFWSYSYYQLHGGSDQRGAWPHEYLYCELDTIGRSDLRFKHWRRPFHSMIISMGSGAIEFTYESTVIRPVDSRRYKRIANSADYYLPLPGTKPPAWAEWSLLPRTPGG